MTLRHLKKCSGIEEGTGGRTHESPDRGKQIFWVSWGPGRENWLREGGWGETARTEGIGDMETRCGGDFLKQVKVILMKSPNNGRDGVLTGQMLPPKQALSAGTGLYPMELLAIAVPGLLPSGKTALHKLTASTHDRRQYPHILLTVERWSCCLHQTFTSTSQYLWKVLCGYQERNINTNPTIHPSIYNAVLSAKCARVIVAQSMGAAN